MGIRKVILKKLTLENWRAQNRTVYFGDTTTISGDNGCGKSSILNAFLWLLTGYDDADRSNFKLFDNKCLPTYENAVPAAVEALLDIDGCTYQLKKVAKQGWARPRGQSEYERKGTDDYSFSIDGIEVSATLYKSKIESLLAPIDKLKIMLNLRSFLMLDWKDMRKQLECMVGEITLDDLKGNYGIILQDLARHTPDELRSLYKSQMKPIKEAKESLPQTIEVMQSNLFDLSVVETARSAVNDAKNRLAQVDAEIMGASDFVQPYIERRNNELAEIDELQHGFNEAKAAYMANYDAELGKVQSRINEIDAYNREVDKQNSKASALLEAKKRELANARVSLAMLQKRHEELTAENNECKSRTFSNERCAYCGQLLPEDRQEEARKQFNERKELDHNYIVSMGKANKERLNATAQLISTLEAETEKGVEPIPYHDKEQYEAELADLRASFVPYEETTEGKAKLAVIEEKRSNLTVVPQCDNKALIEERNKLLGEIEYNSRMLGLEDEYYRQIAKIESLQEELRTNSIELAKLEGKLAKVKEYEEEKAQIVSERVNGRFNYVHIEMSEMNKSGDIVPICTVKDRFGVNALVANNASRILCGLDIAMAFQRQYNLQLPIFIDNAESISDERIPHLQQQVILLVFKKTQFEVSTN